MKTGTAVILGLAGAGAAYLLLKPKEASASDSGTSEETPPAETPSTSGPSDQPTISKRKGILKVVLTLRVSGMEKMVANPNNILKDVLKGARALAISLPTACPGAPKLLGAPTGTIAGTSKGYAIQISFPALWGGTKTGPIKKQALDCIIAEIRKQPKVNARYLSLTAQRTNAYA